MGLFLSLTLETKVRNTAYNQKDNTKQIDVLKKVNRIVYFVWWERQDLLLPLMYRWLAIR